MSTFHVAFAEIHDDETAATATTVFIGAVTVARVPSDNGSCYCLHLWRDTCKWLVLLARADAVFAGTPEQRAAQLWAEHRHYVGLGAALWRRGPAG